MKESGPRIGDVIYDAEAVYKDPLLKNHTHFPTIKKVGENQYEPVVAEIAVTYDPDDDKQLKLRCLESGKKVKKIIIHFTADDEKELRDDIIRGAFAKKHIAPYIYDALTDDEEKLVRDRIESFKRKLEKDYASIIEGKSPFIDNIEVDEVKTSDVHHNEIGSLALNQASKGLRKTSEAEYREYDLTSLYEAIGPLSGKVFTKKEFDEHVKKYPQLHNSPFVVEIRKEKKEDQQLFMIVDNAPGFANTAAHFDPSVGGYVCREKDINALFRDMTMQVEMEDETGKTTTTEERGVWMMGINLQKGKSILPHYGRYYPDLLNRLFLADIADKYGNKYME